MSYVAGHELAANCLVIFLIPCLTNWTYFLMACYWLPRTPVEQKNSKMATENLSKGAFTY